eukprot:TsM_001185800 transcript=TsM_001185800 gene=TsM_001185800
MPNCRFQCTGTGEFGPNWLRVLNGDMNNLPNEADIIRSGGGAEGSTDTLIRNGGAGGRTRGSPIAAIDGGIDGILSISCLGYFICTKWKSLSTLGMVND